MRAKTINENISFEKGQDPKIAMGIGKSNLDNPKNKWKEINPNISKHKYIWENMDIIDEAYETTYKGKKFRIYAIGMFHLSVVFEDESEGFIEYNPGRYYKDESVRDKVIEPKIREFMDGPW